MNNLSHQIIDTDIVEDQLIVDFINGLDVAYELYEHKKQSGIVSRLVDGVVGKIAEDAQSEQHIDEYILNSLKACVFLLKEHEKDALIFAQTLLKFQDALEQTNQKVNILSCQNKAIEQLDYLMDQWQAACPPLSPLGQCYWIINTLFCGEFGQYTQQYPQNAQQMINRLYHKMIIRLQAILQKTSTEKISLIHWVAPPEKPSSGSPIQKILQQQGQKSLANPTHFPTIFTATQWPYLPAEILQKYHHIPFTSQSIEQTLQNMIKEVFERKEND